MLHTESNSDEDEIIKGEPIDQPSAEEKNYYEKAIQAQKMEKKKSQENKLKAKLNNRKKLEVFPRHWKQPPAMQTRDIRQLPGGYGKGSSTLANWI